MQNVYFFFFFFPWIFRTIYVPDLNTMPLKPGGFFFFPNINYSKVCLFVAKTGY